MNKFEDFLKYEDDGEYSQKQLKIMDKISFSEETIDKIKNIKKEINILAVGEVYCPDCRAIIPFFEKFSRLNNNIKILYSNRTESENILKSKTGLTKIPTIFYNDGNNLNVILVEFPKIVLNKMEENPENYDEIKYNFRTGKFNSEIEKELVNYLISL